MRPGHFEYIELSYEAFIELKKLAIEEYGDIFADWEIRYMGSDY
jgi:hypothetical protein